MSVVHRRLELSPDEHLPQDVISSIHESDTPFLGRYYKTEEEDRERFPFHVGMHHRSGKVGSARVRPNDERTVVILARLFRCTIVFPRILRNRLLTSLGNIEATPLAGVTFVSFTTGAVVLYLTGDAHNLSGPTAQCLMPRTNTLTTFHITGYMFVTDGLPVRHKPGTPVQSSPYSPPIRLLAEETKFYPCKTWRRSFSSLSILSTSSLHTPPYSSYWSASSSKEDTRVVFTSHAAQATKNHDQRSFLDRTKARKVSRGPQGLSVSPAKRAAHGYHG
ncbi:hypothetical protein PAXINDRAFT_100898 [Paxillus involutus ATCC 200175]|uniref:Uncharacterized protein n=1 Tax=Paxillus involutus ATCC 200175 TaxID=664439 RepID=A0A0C9SV14_PAXIN|nr:hypothetical protein PAXINDRAFT_100898 [Paxillus involutus ATCC 200175]